MVDNAEFLKKPIKRDCFSVPEGYFQELPEIINAQILEKAKTSGLFLQLKPFILSFSLASVLLLSYIFFPFRTESEIGVFESYIIDEYILIEHLVELRTDESLQENEIYMQILLESDISDSDILSYF